MNTKALKMFALILALMCLVPVAWAGKIGTMNTPLLSCGAITSVTFGVNLCAGATTGAPAGFSLQWVTAAQLANGPDGLAGTLDDNTWPASDSLGLCKASFSGNATLPSAATSALTNTLASFNEGLIGPGHCQ